MLQCFINWICFSYMLVALEGKSSIFGVSLKNKSLWCKLQCLEKLCQQINVAKSFVFCNFCWVKREANGVTHTLCKFALRLPSSSCCNSFSIPALVLEAGRNDVLLCYWVMLFRIIKKYLTNFFGFVWASSPLDIESF
mgnify:CR=1 FL=1